MPGGLSQSRVVTFGALRDKRRGAEAGIAQSSSEVSIYPVIPKSRIVSGHGFSPVFEDQKHLHRVGQTGAKAQNAASRLTRLKPCPEQSLFFQGNGL